METTEQKVSLVEESYQIIRKKICDFELYPEQELSDFTLSKELHMSRTPIRQALQKLEHDGLLCDAGAGKSYMVAPITIAEIKDLFDAREAIESNALRLLMEGDQLKKQLQILEHINELMQEQDRAGNIPLHFELDQMFHNQIIEGSGNRRLGLFYESLNIQLQRMRVLSYLERSYQQKAFNDHDTVLREVKEGNKKQAVKALVKHIRTSKEDFCNLIDKKVSLDSYGMLRFLMTAAEKKE